MMTEPEVQRVALVTGGANGIGRRIAEVLGEAGHKLAIWDIDQTSLDAFTNELKQKNIPALGMVTNITDAERVAEALEQIATTWDSPDILINNAGITRDALLMRLADADWDMVMAVNLKAAFMLTRACLRPMLKKRWGRIVNIASVVGIMGNAGQANYAASKAGLIGLTMSAAREAAPRNVTVNAVAPGFIDTAMTKNLPATAIEEFMKNIPLGRLGRTDDVAQTVAFLASEAAGYITGQVIRVDGGMIMGEKPGVPTARMGLPDDRKIVLIALGTALRGKKGNNKRKIHGGSTCRLQIVSRKSLSSSWVSVRTR